MRLLKFYCASQVPDSLLPDDLVFLPPAEANNAHIALPAGLFELPDISAHSGKFALCQTLDGLAHARQHGLVPIAGEGMNVTNSAAANVLKHLGCAEVIASPEVFSLPLCGALVYGRLRVMLCRTPLPENLTDRKNAVFPVLKHNGFYEIFNSRPLWLAEKALPEPQLFSFTTETKQECARVLDAYAHREPYWGAFTRGAYHG